MVRLVDTLNAALDPATIRTVACSHEYSFEVNGSGIVEWTFDNILLPDSTTNLIESQGFVQFVVAFGDPLMTDQVIENRAAIYFDFNEPVITNIASNLVVDFTTSIDEVEQGPELLLEVFPNPADDYFRIVYPKLVEQGELRIYSINGHLVEEKEIDDALFSTVSTESYPKGLFFIELYDGKNTYRSKLVVQ